MCPYGIDPLFIDDENTARVASWMLHFEDSAGISGADGTFRLRFYDVYGEDWVTEPLALNATCETITAELVDLPNDVINDGTVDCTHDVWTNAAKYTVIFTGNPGYLKVCLFVCVFLLSLLSNTVTRPLHNPIFGNLQCLLI